MKMSRTFTSLALAIACLSGAWAQEYKVPVTNENEKMAEGQYQPHWESLKKLSLIHISEPTRPY